MFGNVFGENGLPQSDEHWMRRFAFVAEVEFTLPPIEKLKGAHRIGDLVAEVVGPAAVSVDIAKMLMQGLGKEPGDYVEVLVMMRGEPMRIFLSRFGRAAGLRGVAGNVEFAGKKH